MATWPQIDASPSSAAVEFNSNSDLGSCGSANAVLLILDRLYQTGYRRYLQQQQFQRWQHRLSGGNATPATTATAATLQPQQTAGLSSTTPT